MNWIILSFVVACLAIVPGAQFKSPQSGKTFEQVVRQGFFELNTNADKALQFFTPEGERSWVKGWDPKPVFPPEAGVVFKANSVFRVDDELERSLWAVIEADLQGHVAEYMYVVEGERLSRVRVQIERLGEQRCRVHVHYVHTATSEKGLQFVASLTEDAFARKMGDWQRMVSAAIR